MAGNKEMWVGVPPEEKRRRTVAGLRASAVKTIVEQWPELTEDQQQRLRALLRPVPEDKENAA
jgi:ribosomal 50S subunit-associated protein YjgA (DUF615 family)